VEGGGITLGEINEGKGVRKGMKRGRRITDARMNYEGGWQFSVEGTKGL